MLQHQAWVTFQGLLELFGANVFDAGPAIEVVFVWLHLVGAILVICAMGVALGRFFRSEELLIPVFAVAIVINVAVYMFSLHAVDLLGAREIAAVLPLGAVLAGRVLAEPLLAKAQAASRSKRWLRPALATLAAGYLGTLAYGAAQPPAPPANQPLAAWLVAHQLTDGLAGYWQANSTTHDQPRPGRHQRGNRGPRRRARAVRVGGRRRATTTRRCATRRSWWPGARVSCRAGSPRRCGPSAGRTGYIAMTATSSWSGTPTC